MTNNNQQVTVIGTHYKGFAAGKGFQKTFKNEAEMEKWAEKMGEGSSYVIEAYSFYQGGR